MKHVPKVSAAALILIMGTSAADQKWATTASNPVKKASRVRDLSLFKLEKPT